MDPSRRGSGKDADPALLPVFGHRLQQGATAAVLLLHGGRADGLQTLPRLNLPALRMRPFAAAVTRATAHDDVLVAHVRYRHRGWNGAHAHPVADTHRALAELRAVAGPVPVVLVGHSMGARAALRAAEHPQVKGVIALAPWCPPGESVTHLRERTIVALHDPGDRVTLASDTWSYLTRAQDAGARVQGIEMSRGGHAMIRHARQWQHITAESAAALLGLTPLPAALTDPDAWTGHPSRAQDGTRLFS